MIVIAPHVSFYLESAHPEPFLLIFAQHLLLYTHVPYSSFAVCLLSLGTLTVEARTANYILLDALGYTPNTPPTMKRTASPVSKAPASHEADETA